MSSLSVVVVRDYKLADVLNIIVPNYYIDSDRVSIIFKQ